MYDNAFPFLHPLHFPYYKIHFNKDSVDPSKWQNQVCRSWSSMISSLGFLRALSGYLNSPTISQLKKAQSWKRCMGLAAFVGIMCIQHKSLIRSIHFFVYDCTWSLLCIDSLRVSPLGVFRGAAHGTLVVWSLEKMVPYICGLIFETGKSLGLPPL